MSLYFNESLPSWLSFDKPSNYCHPLIPNAESPDSNSSTNDGNSSQDEIMITNQAHSLFNLSALAQFKADPFSLETVDQKFKTEICRNFLTEKTCPYGEKCRFAHGKTEQRQKVSIPKNYKTVKCRQFHNDIYCQFGSRCQFIHKNTPKNPKRYILHVNYRVLYQLLQLKYDEQKLDQQNIEEVISLDLGAFKKQPLSVFVNLRNQKVN